MSGPVHEGNKSVGQLQAELINAYFLTGWEGLRVLFPRLPASPEVLPPQINATGSALGLRAPEDREGHAAPVSKADPLLTSLPLHPLSSRQSCHLGTDHSLPGSGVQVSCLHLPTAVAFRYLPTGATTTPSSLMSSRSGPDLEPGTGQMCGWCRPLSPSLLSFLGKMALGEGPGPRAGLTT